MPLSFLLGGVDVTVLHKKEIKKTFLLQKQCNVTQFIFRESVVVCDVNQSIFSQLSPFIILGH